MQNVYDLVIDITSRDLPKAELHRALRDFSLGLGWRPSYHIIEPPFVDDVAKAHLVVEHGLEPSAVVTFLSKINSFMNMQKSDQHRLLEISYNNLVDWHLYVEQDIVSFCFNRTEPFTVVQREQISRNNFDGLRNEAFDQIVGRKPNPNIPNLDEALIKTISLWKRRLAADMGYNVSNENFSALFNAIILARAIEDHYLRNTRSSSSTLIDELENGQRTLRDAIKACLKKYVNRAAPRELLDDDKLAPFDDLDRNTVAELVRDFYWNHYAPYKYDFSLMSKYALSRIYEHYSSLLFIEDSPQASFFPVVPEEDWNKTYGSIYTPQFIARFFARFAREQMPPSLFRRIKTVDPASGSGIFLRTFLELQCDPIQDGVTTEVIDRAFSNVLALDIDENASQATRLSLALLYLTLTGNLPEHLDIMTVESIEYFQSHPELKESFDVVVVNPPFISLETQSQAMRERLASFLGKSTKGRIDTYLAFIQLGLEMLKPGGYGLYVLPHSFLIAENALSIRKRLAQQTWIRCLADLSAIRVFGELGSYVILLVFEKRRQVDEKGPQAAVIKCQDFVGHALEDYLEGRQEETNLYSIYEVDQSEFWREEWVILPAVESRIRQHFKALPTLETFVEIREGLNTGADDIFIVSDETIPKGEKAIFAQFLPDRLMERYSVPKQTRVSVFYPFTNGRKLSSEEVRDKFPETWKYLCSHRVKLENRPPVRRGTLTWWEPERPRKPEHLLRPKIVSPHLVFLPRFSFDRDGKYTVSRSPFLFPKETTVESDLLRYLVAVLNTSICYWYISTHSHKYSRGYAMLEPKTLKHVPIPDPANVPSRTVKELLDLVDRRLLDPTATFIENEIEDIIATLYGISIKERKALGIEL